MKKVISHRGPRFLINVLWSLLMIVSCEDDKPKVLPSLIQFSANLQNIVEGDEATIVLTLDRPAPGNGSVELTIETNAVYSQHFKSDPTLSDNTIVLQIEKGEKSAELKITTVDSDKYEGTRFIIFQLKSKSDDLRLGDITLLTLIIGDDEGPSLANFAARSATMSETDVDGILVEIPFTAPARGEGSLTVTLHAGMAIPGINFTIDQELTNNSFSFNVIRNTTGVSFKVFPIDNDLCTGDFILDFAITEISGVVLKGNILEHTLKLDDDETASVARFAFLSGTVAETNQEGVVVDIQLSGPVKGEGTMTITLTVENLAYGTDFMTLPEAVDNTISLDFSNDQTGGSFTVFPKNDHLLNDDRALWFLILHTSGAVLKGGDSLVHKLTFVDDEEPSIANFAISSAEIDEISSEGMEVEIQFSNPAAGTGQITVEGEAYYRNFTSDPEGTETYEIYDDDYLNHYSYQITVDVAQYAESVSFKILPIDDARCAQHGPTTFTIAAVSGVIRKGNNQTFDLTIKDDEKMLLVILNEKEGTLNENETSGKEIIWNFSNPATADGLITVYSNNYDAGRYTTVPEMVYGSGSGYHVSVRFKKDDTTAQFKVLPINDDIAKSNFTESFNLGGYTGQNVDNGCVEMQDLTYTLTFVDDD